MDVKKFLLGAIPLSFVFIVSTGYAHCCPGPCCVSEGPKLASLYLNGTPQDQFLKVAKQDRAANAKEAQSLQAPAHL